MESLDPMDETFIKFKYDLKFSTVNRREYKSRQEVNLVRDELLEGNPFLEELFPKKTDLTSLHKLPAGSQFKKQPSSGSGSAEGRSREGKKSKSGSGGNKTGNKTRSTDSNTDGAKKEKSNTNSDSEDDSDDEGRGDADEDIEDDYENDEKYKQLDYHEQLVYREQK